MRTKLMASLAVAIAAVAGGAEAETLVSADITVNTTWGSGANLCPIVLENPIFVKSGATLTILPGCIVRGQPRTGPVVPGVTTGTPGALIVTQTGQVIANGAATAPIIMTSAAVDNDGDGVADDLDADGFKDAWPGFDPASGCPAACAPDATPTYLDSTPTTAPLAPLNSAGDPNVSLWGGLVILGNAPNNVDDPNFTMKGMTVVEGLTVPGFPIADATHGGLLPHDSSGSYQFISVRHAGDEIGNSNELNGVTLGSVGDGTIFRNIEVYSNFDDGIEWFGGTVGGRNLHVAFVGDDVFDLDQGYTGVNQFLFGIMPFFNANGGGAFGSASGDKGGEWDGDDFLEATGVCIGADGKCRPWSNPAMYNVTIIGSTPPAGQHFTPVSAASANRGIEMRHGFAGELLNSIVVNTGTALGFDIDSGVGEACPGYDVIDNIGTCTAQVLASTFDDGAAPGADELTALLCGDADARTTTATSDNSINDVRAGGGAFAFAGLVQEDTTFDPQGNASGKLDSSLRPSKINPRPVNPSATIGGVAGAPVLASYRGAFDRLATTLWTDTWTVLSIAGLL